MGEAADGGGKIHSAPVQVTQVLESVDEQKRVKFCFPYDTEESSLVNICSESGLLVPQDAIIRYQTQIRAGIVFECTQGVMEES